MITFTKVASSNIDAIGHYVDTLYVRFNNGGVYQYEGVPRSVYEEMLASESVGRFLGSVIKPAYQGVKVEPDAKEAA